MKEYKVSDEVWHRVVQIVQEAILTGVDCADLLRMIRLTESDNEALVLTSEYKNHVNEAHKKLLEEAKALKAEKSDEIKITVGIINDDGQKN